MRQTFPPSALLALLLVALPAAAQFEAIGKQPKPASAASATQPAPAAPATTAPPPPPSPGAAPAKAPAKAPAARPQPERSKPAPQAIVSKASIAYLEAMEGIFESAKSGSKQ